MCVLISKIFFQAVNKPFTVYELLYFRILRDVCGNTSYACSKVGTYIMIVNNLFL